MSRSERLLTVAVMVLALACLCVRTVAGFVAGHAAWAWRNRPWFGWRHRWRHRRRGKPRGQAK